MNQKYSREQLELLTNVCWDIGQQSFHAPAGETIIYRSDSKFPHHLHVTSSDVRWVVFTLQDEGAIKVIRENTYPRRHWEDYESWEIEVIRDKFKEVEAKLLEQYTEGAESLDAYRPEVVGGGEEKKTPLIRPAGWDLTEDKVAAYIMHNNETVYTFPNNWSAKYKFLKCMWHDYGERVGYEKMHGSYYKGEYPKKDITKINRSMRSIIDKLRRDPEFKKLPIKIKTSKGFILTISD